MASLMDLPIELVQEIGALLPLEAFRATRLTCKRLHSKLWDTFAKRFFRTATVHIIESDLNKLLDIARSDFGQHVQELIVEVDEDSIISILGKDAFGLKEGASANFYESGAEEAVVLSKESAEGFNAFLQEKQDTFARNQHVQLLRQALTSLPGLEALRLSDRGRTRFGQDVYALGGAAVTHLAGVDGRSDLHQHYAAYQRHHHPLRILTASLEGAVVNIQDLYLEFTVDQDLEPLCESFSSSMLKSEPYNLFLPASTILDPYLQDKGTDCFFEDGPWEPPRHLDLRPTQRRDACGRRMAFGFCVHLRLRTSQTSMLS
ncbi:hypothetical protein K491DRAFT_493777 [Lophiostoma macrostomum CBS 122681]|uniref:F-box domain-containing protein n=1 Tax=Lophiostoma macrostomum CBS 122681 TaxID=1314788 RepID=A0A6A6T2P2_9PLEO|nr:hypothetical protein K491DRAFT_493777 [Lophiostoma macrostomum CBS 122681]